MTLGEKLTQCRKQRGLTQLELGEMLGLSPQAISKWENDQSEPDVFCLVKLSEIFDISLDELLAEKKRQPKETPEPDKGHSFLQKLKACFLAHKRLFISIIALVLVLAIASATLLIVGPYTFMQPCSMRNYNRINTGMTMVEIEDILGEPHKASLVKSVGGLTYDSDNSADSAFMDSFYEGISGEPAIVVKATYYYYGDEYGRILAKINKLESKIADAELDDLSKIENWEAKIEELEETLSEIEQDAVLRITFERNRVTEVYLYDGEDKWRKT